MATATAGCANSVIFHARGDVPGWAGLKAQCDLIRCVFGNPFRPVSFDPRWRTGDVLGIAHGAYEDRAFDRLPLLADAIMDAG